jgi:diacylglycerol O-acyltransferase
VDYYGLGVLTSGMGIFHLVFSYSGKITLSVLADRDIMPDPEFYHDCLVAAYEELYAAAIKLGPGKPKSAAIAAKARISSPKRVRAVTGGKVRTKVAANKSTSARATKGAPGKSKSKSNSQTAKTRLKATRRSNVKPTPKLK